MDAESNGGKLNPKYLIVIGIAGALTILGTKFPSVDLGFRLILSVIFFAVAFYVLRDSLKLRWVWITVLPLLALHVFLIIVFLPLIRVVNMWVWGMMILIEGVVVTVIVARASPGERAARRARRDAKKGSL